jgi:hypothetical protein
MKIFECFLSFDRKYKNLLERYKSKWYVNAHKHKYHENAYKIIRNWRLFRLRNLLKSLKVIKLSLRIIYFRHFIYNCNKQKFYNQFLLIMKKMNLKELQNLKEKFNFWRDQCENEKKVLVLKSAKRPNQNKASNVKALKIKKILPYFSLKANILKPAKSINNN